MVETPITLYARPEANTVEMNETLQALRRMATEDPEKWKGFAARTFGPFWRHFGVWMYHDCPDVALPFAWTAFTAPHTLYIIAVFVFHLQPAYHETVREKLRHLRWLPTPVRPEPKGE